ncbi:MAG: hypothetical protein IKM97_06200 [Clostridia bacterium]|nr:hypothetical protein [Clostridia bacterium]
MGKKNQVLKNILFVIIIVFLTISFTKKTIDIDMFFSIKLGENVTKYGLSDVDTLTYHNNLRYVNVRYLYNILVYKIYNTYNFNGIYLFAIICNIINFNLIFYIIKNLTNKNSNVAFIFTVISCFLSRKFLYARTINLSLTIFLIEFYSLKRIIETNKKRYYLIMLILPILLVNIHGSLFLIFFVFYIPYIVEFILSIFDKTKEMSLIKNIDLTIYKKIVFLMLINFLEGLISPFGIIPYILPFYVIFGKSIVFITELQLAKKTAFFICIISFFLSIIFYTEKEKTNNLFYVILLVVLALIIQRAYYYVTTIQIIVLAILFNNYLNNSENNILILLRQKQNIIICIVILFSVLFGSWNFKKNLYSDYINKYFFPVDATKYLLENVDLSTKRLFNGFNSGSYLEFNNIKTFMDSRSEIFESYYNDTTILKDYYDACVTGEKDYKQFIKQYNFDILLVDKSFNLYTKIEEEDNNNLKTLYEDERFIIYEKYE